MPKEGTRVNTVNVTLAPLFELENHMYACVYTSMLCVYVWAGYEETSEQPTGYLFALT